MVNTYAAQSGGCRFESLWGFGFSLKGAYYEVGYCGKKNFLSWTAMHIDFVMCNKKCKLMNTFYSISAKIQSFKVISMRTNQKPSILWLEVRKFSGRPIERHSVMINGITRLPFIPVTNRKQPKSAPYLRLKNIQATTIVKLFNYHTVPKNTRKRFPRD